MVELKFINCAGETVKNSPGRQLESMYSYDEGIIRLSNWEPPTVYFYNTVGVKTKETEHPLSYYTKNPLDFIDQDLEHIYKNVIEPYYKKEGTKILKHSTDQKNNWISVWALKTGNEEDPKIDQISLLIEKVDKLINSLGKIVI